jgi:hypothetical protein
MGSYMQGGDLLFMGRLIPHPHHWMVPVAVQVVQGHELKAAPVTAAH